jgi:phosphonate transport system permease protein
VSQAADTVPAQAARPVPPRRFTHELPSVAIAVAGFVGGGWTALALQGVLWGAIAAAALLLALRLAKERLSPRQQGVLAAGVVASTILSTIALPEIPEHVGVVVSLRFAAAWAPAGLATAVVLLLRGIRPTTAFNAALAWIGAGTLALPAATTFGALVPLESLVGAQVPVYDGGLFAFTGMVIGLVAAGPAVAAVTRLPQLAAVSVLLLLSIYAGAQVGFSPVTLVRDLGRVTEIPNYWPPDFDWAMGEQASGRAGTIFTFSVVWAVVALGAVLFARWRSVPQALRVAGAVLLIGVPAAVFGWWLLGWEFGVTRGTNPIIETFRIAIIAATLGCGVALPVAFMASQMTAPNNPTYLLNKGFMNLIRTMPDLFWALVFVASVGIGPFAGAIALVMFSLAIMAKLLSETIDAADPRPLEAAKATGSPHFPAIRSSVLPQVLPNYVAYALYIFEINIRASVVIGLVGAGGIGRVLEAQRQFFRFDRVLAIVTVIFVIVFVIEQISVSLRRRLV